MVMRINTVVISGILTKDPIPFASRGARAKKAILELAVEEKWRSPATQKGASQVEFFSVCLQGTVAEVALKQLKEGDIVLVHGRLRGQSGGMQNDFNKTEVVGKSIQLINTGERTLSIPSSEPKEDD